MLVDIDKIHHNEQEVASVIDKFRRNTFQKY